MAIRNPIEWGLGQFGVVPRDPRLEPPTLLLARSTAPPRVAQIGLADLRYALRAGFADFGAARTDVVMLCILYPVMGLVLARLAFGYGVLPLLFPLAAGFALLGPAFAVGLNEMSRRRERGLTIAWGDAFAVMRSPGFPSIVLMGLLLLAIFVAWLVAAGLIYDATLGPQPPASIAAFVHAVLTTPKGWLMIVVGMGVGFLFALLVLAISVVSFPLLLDRDQGLETAVTTSLQALRQNPRVLATWGLIVAVGLVAGSLPLFLGLAIVLPVLGHATWHLYRRLVPS